MNPETAQLIAAIVSLLEKGAAAPLGIACLFILFGPWMFTYIINRSVDKRFEAMKQMYQSNVKLVDCYEKLATRQDETIILNTAKWTEVSEEIKTNQFCPMNRTKKHRMEDVI
jgi:hypothetical protein